MLIIMTRTYSYLKYEVIGSSGQQGMPLCESIFR